MQFQADVLGVPVIRPEVIDFSGAHFTLYRGVPTGSQISVFLFNFYLLDFDAVLDRSSLYLRYCDDFVVFTKTQEEAIRNSKTILQKLETLELTVKAEKSMDLYFNGAGKTPENFPGAKGTQRIHFLGWSLHFDGTVGLGVNKSRRLRDDLRERLFKTNRVLSECDLETRGRLMCRTINEVFKPSNEFSQTYAGLLLRAVNDRSQLKEFDYWIVRTLLRVLTGNPGVRAFRKIPYRKIRRDWGLISLVQNRNAITSVSDGGNDGG